MTAAWSCSRVTYCPATGKWIFSSATVTQTPITDITALANGDSERASISANGHVVIFASDATNLVPGDTNGLGDTFVYDLQTQTFQLLSVAMDGTQGNGDSMLGADLGFGGNTYGLRQHGGKSCRSQRHRQWLVRYFHC